MDEELRRFEEKQKLSNLQIDKRLAMLEGAVEDLKTEFESLPMSENVKPLLEKISSDVESMKRDEGIRYPQLAEVKKLLDEAKININTKVKELELMQKQMLSMEARGKLPQCENDIENLKYDISTIQSKIKDIERRLEFLERNFVNSRMSQPVIIE